MTISIIAIVVALVFFGVGLGTVYKGKAAATVTFAVSVLVAFVPEGLPSVVTLLYAIRVGHPVSSKAERLNRLSIAAKRMAAQNVLVKDLQGVETLGALYVTSLVGMLSVPICMPRTLLATDKTGTLTRNQMTVQSFMR